jgi:hypothetical protein
MLTQEGYAVALFESVSHALSAEKMIKAAGIDGKLIHVPRHLSSDCGVCLRFSANAKERVENILQGKLNYFEIKLL